ncbi:peptide/nickel transport system permease protein [Amphibacillus marinus]|uniref:Peptide/nickel transport system permease protein n=1 Tax=Amphibacillus marinus TaxID=872970 RepID=A0A1H8PL96_9BACI|nr:ABC transporter permease [Amphibacillus marinus]SEO42561.1 peptide/nickel transport system permease protein [Amphibacillus marinus]
MLENLNQNKLIKGYRIVNQHPLLNWLQCLLGLPIFLIGYSYFLYMRKKISYSAQLQDKVAQLHHSKQYEQLLTKYAQQYKHKQHYFNRRVEQTKQDAFARAQANQQIRKLAEAELSKQKVQFMSFTTFFEQLLANRNFVILSFVLGFLIYSLYFIYQNAFVRFVFERFIMTLFVIVSVIVIVFTILYISPSDSAANILGESATLDQRLAFNKQYGLDQPYFVQLWRAISGFLRFDLGHSFTGNEVILTSIANRFPVTLILAITSLFLAVCVAVPIGMVSAAKLNSFWDYSFMFLALIGLSIPSFWQGLIFILTFSIRANWLPSSYSPNNLFSLIMPILVLGTGLAAAITRMTRSSILEVMHEDYMVTAKAKGLSGREAFLGHALRNAWIPILTVIGLQFGVMLGGAAVTEKVFNIRGLGSYIVDKQFIPDIPAILAGVVYIAIAISVVNLIVDLLYAILNPRIRAQLKNN